MARRNQPYEDQGRVFYTEEILMAKGSTLVINLAYSRTSKNCVAVTAVSKAEKRKR